MGLGFSRRGRFAARLFVTKFPRMNRIAGACSKPLKSAHARPPKGRVWQSKSVLQSKPKKLVSASGTSQELCRRRYEPLPLHLPSWGR